MNNKVVTVTGIKEVQAHLLQLSDEIAAAVGGALSETTTAVLAKSILNAPISPTMAQLKRVKRKTRQDTRKRKKAGSYSRPVPGGLERSIEMEYDQTELRGEVFVAANSEAGKYAERIHDDKYVSWHNRGIGTIAKGSQADDLFIERALDSEAENLDNRIEKALTEAGL